MPYLPGGIPSASFMEQPCCPLRERPSLHTLSPPGQRTTVNDLIFPFMFRVRLPLHFPFPFHFIFTPCRLLHSSLSSCRAMYEQKSNLAFSLIDCFCLMQSFSLPGLFCWDAFWPCFAPLGASASCCLTPELRRLCQLGQRSKRTRLSAVW